MPGPRVCRYAAASDLPGAASAAPARWPTLDRIFAAHVGRHRPARGVVDVVRLHRDAAVGMQLTAAVTK
jgi:hypothetical protein